MADFLETLDRIQMEQHEVQTMFSKEKDGTSVRSATKRRFKSEPVYRKNLLAATKLISEVYTGARPIWQLQEVMTTDDFPVLFGDILDRSVLAAYQDWPARWEDVAKRVVLRDFRDAKIYPPMWGADGPLDKVKEAAPYPHAPIHEQDPLVWSADKFGRQVPFSWETMINDDLDQLKDVPVKLGQAARRTEDWNVVGLYAGASGYNTTLYNNTNKNVVNIANGAIHNNPVLGLEGLQDAFLVMNNMLDLNGFPILREYVTLVVPPALEITARNIINATEIDITAAAGGGVPGDGSAVGYQRLRAVNWMRNRLKLVVNPYLPMISTTANANTTWYLFADPNYSREAIRIGFMRGHETPEIWMKSANAVRVGGGDVDAMSGDFDTDTIQYRIRHVLAFATIDPKATVASKGTGNV